MSLPFCDSPGNLALGQPKMHASRVVVLECLDVLPSAYACEKSPTPL